ncbi:hypothetical protein I3400192H8_09130 [Dialister sp. i34-0019-2H8]
MQCLCDTDRSARKIEGNAFDDGGASKFYAPHHYSSLLTPNWRVELSHAIKGKHSPRATLNP